MAVGYVTGGITHGMLANRAHDDECANRYFYPVFAVSYLSMIGSSFAWLSTAQKSLKQVAKEPRFSLGFLRARAQFGRHFATFTTH